jgi:hypothetical protein
MYPDPSGMAEGYYGYAYTFVTATGETTASPRVVIFNRDPAAPVLPGGGQLVNSVGTGSSTVTSRILYRTASQATEAAAITAQLKLRGTISGNTVQQFDDHFVDASLGVNVPTVNTATVHIEALTTIDHVEHFIGFLDGYGLALNTDTSILRISAIEDFSTWNDLDVAQRNDAADRWASMVVSHKEIWLFGSETTSVYYNSFGPSSAPTDFPFTPIPSVFIPIGIGAPHSACVVDGSPMWIGRGVNGIGVVYRANGYTPERVSTHAVEYAFSQLPTANLIAAEGSTYQEDGHIFYELTFPTLLDGAEPGATWVYDVTAGLWHERGRWDGLVYVELDTRGHAFNLGQQYTISRTTGQVWIQSVAYSVGTDGVTGIRRLRRAPHIIQAQQRIRYSHMRLLMETGLGLSTGQGSDPQVMLRWSDDGGQSFGAEYLASAGKIGSHRTLVDWWQLGQGRDRIFEVSTSDPTLFRLIDCWIDYSIGPS